MPLGLLLALLGAATPSPVPYWDEHCADVTFVDPSHGWALWEVVDHGDYYKLVLRGTSDGGRTWYPLRAPFEGPVAADGLAYVDRADLNHVDSLRFSDRLNGWAFGPGLFATHDGGKTWTHVSLKGQVFAVESWGRSVWAVASECSPDYWCARKLIISNDYGRTWHPAKVQPSPSIMGSVQLLRTSAADAWIAYAGNNYPSASNPTGMVLTHDGGRTWQTLTEGCNMNAPILRGIPGQQLWLMCSHLSSGAEQKKLFLSQDRGLHWAFVADSGGPYDSGQFGNLTGGRAVDMAVQARDHAWILYNNYDWRLDGVRSGLQVSTDGGHTWREPAMTIDRQDSERIDRIVFLNANDGWLGGQTTIFRTTDGGKTWERGLNVQPTRAQALPLTGQPETIGLLLAAAVAILLLIGGSYLRWLAIQAS